MTYIPNIILATDFTDASDHAVDYSVRLFDGLADTKPHYFLLHGFKPMVPYTNTPSMPVMSNDALEQEFKTKLASQREQLQEKEDVDAYLMRGNVQEAIQKLNLNGEPDLIVMGSRKKDTFTRMTVGTHTINVANEATCPVLAVPLEAKNSPIDKIVLVVLDDKAPNARSIKILESISNGYNSKITVLHASDEDGFEAIHSKVHSKMNGLNHDHIVLSDGENYEEITQTIEELNPDMVALIADDANFFQKIFHNSVSEKMIYYSRVPTLILKSE